MTAPDLPWDLQRTAIEDLTVEAAIGVADWERVPGKRQRLRFDVAVFRDAFGAEQALGDCYDYAALQAFLAGFGERPHVDLLETILAEVLDFCFRDERVVAAEARIAKPDVFNGKGVPSVAARVGRDAWRTRRRR